MMERHAPSRRHGKEPIVITRTTRGFALALVGGVLTAVMLTPAGCKGKAGASNLSPSQEQERTTKQKAMMGANMQKKNPDAIAKAKGGQ